ncbi:MAG: acetylornithine deacetylase [Flavobacteriaceae bacterium]|nr:acetylornithine deacetylase [Flavobacteriaceae bacterium]
MTVTEILEKLVSFDVLGGESNTSIITWIKKFIEAHGVQTTLVPNTDGTKANLHCRIGPAVDGGVILSGHTDVVPVKGQSWTTDPFTLTQKEDKLYGRGSCDMKGFVACCLAALPDMIQANLQKPIYFAFSYDEEVGCIGAPSLIKSIQATYTEKPTYVIVGEPTMMQPIVGQKGIHIVDITVHGSEGHSSRIMQEVSAVHEAAKLVVWLEQKMHHLIDNGMQDTRFNPPHSSMHIGQIHGGIAANVIAHHCKFSLDIRTIPSDDLDNIIAEIEAHCKAQEIEGQKKNPNFKIEIVDFHPPVPALDTKDDSPVIPLIAEITGNNNTSGVSYGAEAGHFHLAGYQTIICGPGNIAQAHRANEFIAVDQLELGMEMLGNLMKKCTE